MMTKLSVVAACAAVLLAASSVLADGGSSIKPDPQAAAPEKTPAEQAIEHYNWGVAARENAWKLERELAQTTDAKQREKLESKIEKQYKRALGEYERAVDLDSKLFQAHSDLGYCLRKTGRYEEALAAYDRALAIEPRYAEAIEYRAEAYLGLNRVDEAKQAYVDLFSGAREQADKLLDAMRAWVAARQGDGKADAETLASFAGWIAEREEIARVTKPVSELRGSDW